MSQATVPILPEIGLPPGYYSARIHEAEKLHEKHAFEAQKVGLYVTRAINECDEWPEKERCFVHALHRHTRPPAHASEDVVAFYARLSHMVREHAGQEALRIASRADDDFARRLSIGQSKDLVKCEARAFFHRIIPHSHRPEWCNLDDFQQLKVFRQSWGP